MAQPTQGHIEAAIASILPAEQIRGLAQEMGVVMRRRKVDIAQFIRALVLGFCLDRSRTLNGLRQAYQLLTGDSLARSSFYARFTAALVQLLEVVVANALSEPQAPKVRDAFGAFREVLALDSCIMRLHDALSSKYPGLWHPAGVKLTMLCNVVGRTAHSLRLSPGRTADVHLFDLKMCQPGRLFIFDLGFFQALLFSRIQCCGGFFLSRLKKHSNLIIVGSHQSQLQHLVGLKLREALASLTSPVVEFDVQVPYIDRLISWSQQAAVFRIVCVRNDADDQWHGYITNAPANMLAAQYIAAIYAARWETELLFRELQSDYRIDQHPSANRHVTEALLYAAVLTLLVSRKLHRLVRESTRLPLNRLPLDRWARVFSCHAAQLLGLLAHPSPQAQNRLLALLCHEAPDPNRHRKRPLLPERAQNGCAFA